MLNSNKEITFLGTSTKFPQFKTFVSELRPFIILFKVVGLLPIENIFNENINEWRYRKLSFSTLLLVLIYIVTSLTMLLYQGIRFNTFYEFFDKVLGFETIVLVCILLKSLDSWIAFIKSVDCFDKEFRSYGTQTNYTGISNCSKILGFWLLWITTTGLFSRLLSCHSVKNPVSIAIRLQAVLVIEGMDFFYIAVCSELKLRYKKLEESFKRQLEQKHNVNQPLDRLFENYRKLHRSLGFCISNLNSVFGIRLFTNIMIYMFNTLLNLYFTIYLESHCSALKIVYIAKVNSLLIALIIASDELSLKATKGLRFLLDIPPNKLNQSVKYQLTLYLWQLKFLDTTILGAGIIKINRSLIGTCAMLLATYFIAIVQLSPEINKLSENYFNSSSDSKI